MIIPPLLFEKYTFHLYLIADPNFFTYSGSRLGVDAVLFILSGMACSFIVGRGRRLSALIPFVSSAILVFSFYAYPLCGVKECYVSSPDGLAAVRDWLFFGSLGFLASTMVLRKKALDQDSFGKIGILDGKFLFAFVTSMLLGFALSFFPLVHIFAGVSVAYPLNYLQWFVAGGPPALAGTVWAMERTNGSRKFGFLCGFSGILLSLALTLEVPCLVCDRFVEVIASIISVALVFSLLGLVLGSKQKAGFDSRKKRFHQRERWSSATLRLAVTVGSLIIVYFFLTESFEASVVSGFAGNGIQNFSPVEVGHGVAYAGGYLPIPRVVSSIVGVNLSFPNTAFSSKYANDFIAAGIGVQSPNCCKDGLDLSYRIDAVEFGNGTQAVLARAWWACDLNIACGGYTWQQLLFAGSKNLPANTLSSQFIELRMNLTATGINWFYRIEDSRPATQSLVLFASFVPPRIQNHYFDAGLFYTGPSGNPPILYALFYQFGVFSGYPITNGFWHVIIECPYLVLNGSSACLPSANFISGEHSYWKLLYRFGQDYPGVGFKYLGNQTVEFYYAGSSPADETKIWQI